MIFGILKTNPSFILRFGIALTFAFFGIFAVLDPPGQSALWIRPEFAIFFGRFIPLDLFVFFFGVLELFIAIALVTGLWYRAALWLAAISLVAVIIDLVNFNNIFANDLAIRDFAILTAVLYLLFKEEF